MIEPDLWGRAFDWLGLRGAPRALGFVTVTLGVLFSGVFRGETVGDDLTFHMAESARIADCIRAGDWDLWNPSANGGFASAYYYQVLPQLASALPAALFGHHLFWFQLSLYLPIVLAPAAGYRGARLLGATPWQAFAAALAIGFLSGQSRWGGGADGTFQVGLYTQTWALAAFPLGLGHGVRWLLERRGLVAAIGWGAFVFLCHPFVGISLYLALGFGTAAHYLCWLARFRAIQLLLLGLVAFAFVLNALSYATDLELYKPGTGVDPDDKLRLLYLVPLIVLGALLARLIWNVLRRFQPGAPEPELRSGEDHDGMATAQPAPHGVRPLLRLIALGACILIATLPGWLPVILDRDGFGGFPHRVNDEVGPGYKQLMSWQLHGWILDNGRPMVLTWLLPAVLLFARTRFLRWLWTPALIYAALLALGPHVPKTADDLLPAVRFLGAMQVVLAMAIGAGAHAIALAVWHAGEHTPVARMARVGMIAALAGAGIALAVGVWISGPDGQPLAVVRRLSLGELSDRRTIRLVVTAGVLPLLPVLAYFTRRGLASQFWLRTGVAAIAGVLIVFLVIPGVTQLGRRVRVLEDYGYRDEMMQIIDELELQPQGRKQVGPGCENHWWNLLSYVYGRRPSLLQMGGGGLQASPNYDFLWSVRDFAKLAWVYDTPYFVFQRSTSSPVPEGETILQIDDYELRRLRAPGLVSPVHITGVLPAGPARARTPTRDAAIAWLRSDLPFDSKHLAYAGHGGPGSPPDARVLRAFRQDSPGDAADIHAEVSVARPSTFVARESWHPRWHAYIDGVEVPIRRITPDFPAIDVPAGDHTLAFRFERPWWAHAAWLAWPGIALAAWLALLLLDRRRIPRGRLPVAIALER